MAGRDLGQVYVGRQADRLDLEGDPRPAPGPPPRQALHAWRARLRHPRSGAPLTLTAPLPRDFIATAREALRDC